MTSEARLFANILVVGLADGGPIAVCVFAWLKGRTAERFGSTLYLASCLATVALGFASGQKLPTLAEFVLDLIVSAGFLYLAIRYNNLWLGAAMMIKGLQLGLHAMHMTDLDDARFAGANVYLLLLDFVGMLISLTIFLGTLASIRERRRGGEDREAPLEMSGGVPG